VKPPNQPNNGPLLAMPDEIRPGQSTDQSPPSPETPLTAPQHIAIDGLGIDIGFFSTKFTTGKRDKKTGEAEVRQFPSVAPRIAGTMRHIALMDKLKGAVIEVEPGVLHFVGDDVYQVASTSGSRGVTADYSRSSDYKALFLGVLFHIAKEHGATNTMEIDTVVAGLPISTIYTHAADLSALIQGAHQIPSPVDPEQLLTVHIRHAMVIAQPQGALVSRGVETSGAGGSDLNTLVLDMGGGTFDWFVAKGVRPNRSLSGAVSIGALACAGAICDEIKSGLRENPEIMARVDRALRENSRTVLISGIEHEMASFAPIVSRVMADAIEQMRKSVGSLDSMDKILLTGGAAKLLLKGIEATLGAYTHLIHIDKEPVSSNVRGFHSVAVFQAKSR
jgi:plasmid segregation protein ParM